jgi:cobalt/nickel transport system ATP-binding protein
MPTVIEDVAFGPLQSGLSPDQAETLALEGLTRVGMAHLRDRPPYRLSAGEKRAVAIASVLAQSPSVLALDEPSANLDPRARRRLLELLRSFEHTRIVATHDLELALAVCTHTVVLDDGRVVAQGPTRDLLADEPLMLAHGLERPASLAAG